MIRLKTLYAHPLQAIGFLLLALTFLHFIGLKIEPVSFTARAYIGEFEFLTGVWCWTLASLLIISATRPSFIEKFGSLDSILSPAQNNRLLLCGSYFHSHFFKRNRHCSLTCLTLF